MIYDIPGQFKNLLPGALDSLRGPYATVQAACDAIQNVMVTVDGVQRNQREGKIVDIGLPGFEVEHRWKGGFTDEFLVKNLLPADLSITPEKTSFITKTQSRNRFNPTDVNINLAHYLNENNSNLGEEPGNAGYNITGRIIWGEQSQAVLNKNARSIVQYNSDNTPIVNSGFNSPVAGTVINRSPGASYFKACINTADWNGLLIQFGSIAGGYEAYYPAFYTQPEVRVNQATEALKEVIRQFVLTSLSINTAQVANKAITVEKSEFFKDQLGKNKFNINDPRNAVGYFVNASNGNLETGSGTYNATHPIACSPGASDTLSYKHQVAWFTAQDVYITGSSSGVTNKTIVHPPNSAYYRATVVNTSWAQFQAESGTDQTIWEAYSLKKILRSDVYSILADGLTATGIAQIMSGLSIGSSQINNGSITPEKASFILAQGGKNIFNPADANAKLLFYLNENSNGLGNLAGNSGYNTSGFMPFLTNTQFTINKNYRSVVFYDASNVPLRGVGGGVAGANIAKNAGEVYFRVCVATVNWSGLQIEYGASVTTYEAFKQFKQFSGVKLDYNDIVGNPVSVDDFLIFLPSEIYVAAGRTIEIYNKQVVWCGNYSNYHFFWSGVGQSKKRKWTFKGTTEAIGQYALTLKVYNNNMVQVATATTTVKVVSALITTPFSLCTIGDSLSNNKPWQAELRALSANQISLIGTRVDSATQKHEGRSGAGANYYLANSSYLADAKGITGNDGRTQNLNPFWNPNTGVFDFAYYKSNYNQNPDRIMIWLGTNGMSLDPAINVTSIKAIVDGIRTVSPNIPIYVAFTLYRANQDGIANQPANDGYQPSVSWKLEEDRKVFNLQVALYAALKGYSNMKFIPLSLSHDSEYNYGSVATAVNPRAAQTENEPIESIHPQTQGYMQCADIIFSAMAS